MTFEEDFPSLKGKEGFVDRNTVHCKAKNNMELVFMPSDIQEHCLDKQRVKENLDYLEEAMNMGILDGSDFILVRSELGL